MYVTVAACFLIRADKTKALKGLVVAYIVLSYPVITGLLHHNVVQKLVEAKNTSVTKMSKR